VARTSTDEPITVHPQTVFPYRKTAYNTLLGDFPSHLEAPDYSPDRSFPKFVIRKINYGESVFPVDKSKKSMLEK